MYVFGIFFSFLWRGVERRFSDKYVLFNVCVNNWELFFGIFVGNFT